jgi:hypothetical protein
MKQIKDLLPKQQLVAKEVNTFYHPMQGTYNFDRELQYQIKLGA